jgi:hypothetical protein
MPTRIDETLRLRLRAASGVETPPVRRLAAGRGQRRAAIMAAMSTSPMVYLIACGAPPAGGLRDFLVLAHDRGLRPVVVLTPHAVPFAGDLAELEALSGHRIRTGWRRPGEVWDVPDPEAVVVAPATFNTINKLAGGIADTLGAAIACEAIGIPVPVVVATSVKGALSRHPAFVASVARLREWGVRVVTGQGDPPSAPMPPWERVVGELEEALRDRREPV